MGKLKGPETTTALVELITQSNLFSQDLLVQIRESVASLADPTDVARKLLKDKLLTKWQATQLLAGFSGFTVGPYRLCDQIGRDAISRTYLAEGIDNRQAVVLRFPLAKFSQDAEFRQQFLHDGATAARIAHSNLSKVVEVRADTDPCALVTEFPNGTDLQTWVTNRGPLSASQTNKVLRQILVALNELHACGLLHLGIEPKNVYCSDGLDAKLLYSPCSRELRQVAAGEDAAAANSSSPQGTGTPEGHKANVDSTVRTNDFASPEQVSNSELTVASDWYSLGLTAFYAATGKLPFEGTVEARRLARKEQAVSKLISVLPLTSDGPTNEPGDAIQRQILSQAIENLCALRPGDRPVSYQNAISMLDSPQPESDELRLVPIESEGTKPIRPEFAIAVTAAVVAVESKPVAAAAAATPLSDLKIRRSKKPGTEGELKYRVILKKSNLPGLILATVSLVGFLLTIMVAAWIFFGSGGENQSTVLAQAQSPAAEKKAPQDTGKAASEQAEESISDVAPVVVADEAVQNIRDTSPTNALVASTANNTPGSSSSLLNADSSGTSSAPDTPPVVTTSSTASVSNEAPLANPATTSVTVTPTANPKTTEVAKVEPRSATESPPEPPPDRPLGKPFAQFPGVIDLPLVESTDPFVLGRIAVGERDLCFLKLKGTDGVTKSKMKFGIRNAQDGTAERDWEITYGSGASTSVVATLQLRQQKLTFRWEESIAQPGIAGNLRNAVLNLNAGPETHDLVLRSTQRARPILVSVDRADTKERWLLDSLPPPESLRLQITSVAGGQKVILVPAEISLAGGSQMIWLSEKVEDAVFGLRMDATLSGKNLQVSFLPHFQTIMAARPAPLNKGNTKKVVAQLSVLPRLRLEVEGLKKVAADTKKKNEMQNQLLDAQKRLADMETAVQQHENLRQIVEQLKGGCEVRFRLFYRADDKEVVLLETNGP